MDNNFGVYIHIPFCKQKCFYCDFPSFAGRERFIDNYLAALGWELELAAEKYGEQGRLKPATVYVGGGTPSLLTLTQMEGLFAAIDKHINLDFVDEFTIEANPGTLTVDKLRLMKAAGVNRLSIGVQSLDDDCLKKIGRIHTVQEAVESVRMAQEKGFDNISIDLMYGLPGQTMETLKASVEKALTLDVQHISIYGLQLEEGTVFSRQQEMGKLQLPDDEQVEMMYDYITEVLPLNDYTRYEISNYALPGFESKHNCLYWQDVSYLGFGAGAHSYWQGSRYENPADIEQYISRISGGEILGYMEEQVGEKEHMEEFCFLGLRMTSGIKKGKFKEVFNKDIHEVFGETIKEMKSKDLLEETNTSLRLTKLGTKYGNVVFGAFII